MLLYSAPLSLFSRKVEITLVEKGVSFDRVLVPFTQTKGYAQNIRLLSLLIPSVRFPCLSMTTSRFTIQP